MIETKAYAAQSPQSPLAPFVIDRRDPGPDDVQIQILYCGVSKDVQQRNVRQRRVEPTHSVLR